MTTQDMTPVTVMDAVKCILLLPADIPSFLWGEPGMGKTDSIEQSFEKTHKVIHVLVGQSEPSDIGGIPFNYKDLYAKYLMPWWLFLASNHPDLPKYLEEHDLPDYTGPLVIFFDDLVTAHEQTQAALYKVVDEKRAGEYRIRENVRMIGAGNRVADLSAVTDMPKALCNRFMHFYVEPDFPTWERWASGAGIHPHILFFLRKFTERLSDFKEAKEAVDCHAWATPRTWEMLSKMLFTLDEAKLRGPDYSGPFDYETPIVQGCIGALAHAFLSEVRDKYQTIPISEILKNPEKCEVPSHEEPDRLYATCSNVEYWFSHPENHKHYREVLVYAERLPADFSIILIRKFFSMMGEFDEKILAKAMASEDTQKILDKWADRVEISL